MSSTWEWTCPHPEGTLADGAHQVPGMPWKPGPGCVQIVARGPIPVIDFLGDFRCPHRAWLWWRS